MLRSRCAAVRPQDAFKSSWEISTLLGLKEGGSSQVSSGRSPPSTSERRSWRGGCTSDQGPITSLLSITILKRQMYWKPHRLYSDTFRIDRLYEVQTMTTSHRVSSMTMKTLTDDWTSFVSDRWRSGDDQYGFHNSWSEKTGTCWSSEPKSTRKTNRDEIYEKVNQVEKKQTVFVFN